MKKLVIREIRVIRDPNLFRVFCVFRGFKIPSRSSCNPVLPKVIKAVKEAISIPLIVGGGIRSEKELQEAYDSGADLVVIGTAFEENSNLLINFTKNEHIH